MQSSIISIEPEYTSQTCTLIANTTGMKQVFERAMSEFSKLWRRKACLQYYKWFGLDEMEIKEGEKLVRDLFTEYNDKHDAVVDLEEDDYWLSTGHNGGVFPPFEPLLCGPLLCSEHKRNTYS